LIKEPCPLCHKQRPRKKFKPLYLTPVCHKCYYKFANRRQIAFVIDVILWRIAMTVLFIALGMVIFAIDPRADVEPWEISLTLLAWLLLLVFILKDGFAGCSAGKAICGVRVVDRDTHEPVGFGRSFKRNLPTLIPFAPLVLAFTLGKGRRLGDGWANTKVIWSKYRYHPVFNADRYCPRCQYDLRGNTSGACPECGRVIDENTMRHLGEDLARSSACGAGKATQPDIAPPTSTRA
jgi:uncharacterized RDD family membrane protein YckC